MKPLAERKTLKPRPPRPGKDRTRTVHVRVLPELREEYMKLAKELGIPFSEMVRQALAKCYPDRLHRGED